MRGDGVQWGWTAVCMYAGGVGWLCGGDQRDWVGRWRVVEAQGGGGGAWRGWGNRGPGESEGGWGTEGRGKDLHVCWV